MFLLQVSIVPLVCVDIKELESKDSGEDESAAVYIRPRRPALSTKLVSVVLEVVQLPALTATRRVSPLSARCHTGRPRVFVATEHHSTRSGILLASALSCTMHIALAVPESARHSELSGCRRRRSAVWMTVPILTFWSWTRLRTSSPVVECPLVASTIASDSQSAEAKVRSCYCSWNKISVACHLTDLVQLLFSSSIRTTSIQVLILPGL